MITMEFEEMKKIWDEQNQEQLYAINEAALRKRIQSKLKRARRLSDINDFGLIAVALVTPVILWLTSDGINAYHYTVTTILMLIIGYVLYGRNRRKKIERRFDRSILGELDHTIANVAYEARRARTMVWWFMVPLAIPTIIAMIWKGAPLWSWVVVLGMFLLSYVVVRWELNRCHIPKKQKLEALRDKLTEELKVDS
jgi:hypothetical protein